jgi:hypothetical protein
MVIGTTDRDINAPGTPGTSLENLEAMDPASGSHIFGDL